MIIESLCIITTISMLVTRLAGCEALPSIATEAGTKYEQ